MAGYSHSPVRSKGAGEYVFAHVLLNIASGSPTISEDYGDIVASVADTGTGIWTLTLNDKWYKIQGWANVENSDGDHVAQVTPTAEGGSTATVVVTLQTAGSLADDDCDINVYFMMLRGDA